MNITIAELTEAVGGKLIFGDPSLTFRNITTASNLIKGDDLFIPIKGERTDGHKYIGGAFSGGAVCSLTEEPEVEEGLRDFSDEKALILVDSTVAALQKFGAYFRKKYVKIPYVGITGSVGKTTTREITSAALSAGFRVYTTKGNANSQVGVPITVFETDEEAGIGVIELGISEFGEMEKISSLAAVDTACITNIGICHIAQFGTQENILREKLGILRELPDGGTIFVNGDDPILKELTEEKIHSYGYLPGKKVSVKYYGTGENSDVRAVNITKRNGCCSFDAIFKGLTEAVHVDLTVPGEHMMMNALCALSVCALYGVPLLEAAENLSQYQNFEGRGNRIERNGVGFINDAYNASPVSVKAGLAVLKDAEASGRKFAVLADMKELGEKEQEYHREIGEYIAENFPELPYLYTYGDLAALIAEAVRGKNVSVTVKSFTEIEALKEDLFREVKEGDLVFLKGSNSMGLKRVLS